MRNMKKIIRDSLLVVIGNAIVAFGIAVFAVPANLIVGGATGLSLIIGHFIPLNYATIVFGINLVMLMVGFLVLGKKFAAMTILSTFVFPFFLGLFENIAALQNITNDILLATIYAGIFVGLGLGIVIRLGYSTGGMDIPPIILNKKFNIPVALSMNILDVIILVGQVFFSNFEGILYGIITVLVTTFVLDQVIVLGEKNLQLLIISAKHEEIAEVIFNTIDRGCTFVNVTTGYFKNKQQAVLCVASKRQCITVNELVLEIDPTAFIIESEIHSVRGRGFTLSNIDLEKDIRDHA